MTDHTPPYLRVTAELSKRIVSGELSDGDRLPSIREITEQFGISQATAQKVLAQLRADGLAESKVGSGTVVRVRHTLHRTAADRLEAALATGRIYAKGEHAVIMAADVSVPPKWVADLLGLEPGVQAVRRRRVTRNEECPVSTSTSWFAPEMATAVPALLQRERIIGGTVTAIANATGRRAVDSEEATSAGVATEEIAHDLEIPVGSPVALGRNVYVDSDGEPIEIGESAAPAGRWRTHRRR